MNRRAFVAAAIAAAGALSVFGCSAPTTPSHAVERHELTGRVVAVDAPAGRVTLAHKAIPGFMDAMTMELAARPPSTIASLTPGDRIRATLVVDRGGTWLEGVERLSGDGAGFDVDDAKDPEIGAAIPRLELEDQNGRRFDWERFRGRTVLVSFIYTRCPLPDYCARMTSNFESVSSLLDSLPADRRERMALLSVTIDPEFDTPAVLRAYAAQQAPSAGNFERWTFATGSPEEVRAVARFFGLSYERQSGQIIHSLRTVVVGPDLRVAAIFRGNAWTPDEAVRALASADARR